MVRKMLINLAVICFLSTIFMTALPIANATLNGSVIYGSPDSGQMSTAEAQATSNGCSSIRYYFSVNNHYIYLQNYCGSSTNYNTVYSVANYMTTYPYDWATVFYKGDSHFLQPYQSPNTYGHNIYWLYSDVYNGGLSDHIWDEVLGQYTSTGVYHFAFLWTCSMANEMGGINGNDIYGMAPAWLHTTNLQLDSYNNPDYTGKCFIGFQAYSKPWTDYTGYYSYTYQIFGTMFYYYATGASGNYYNVHNALNQASLNYLGSTFSSSSIYTGYYYGNNLCKLRVFGDSSMVLP